MNKNTAEQTGSFTILERALQTYEQWHKKTGFSLRALFGTGTFPQILKAAGYNADKLSDLGCFLVPVQREPLVAALTQILAETDDQDLEYSAVFLAGVLNAVELVPAIRASLRRNIEFSVAPVMAARSLYILGVPATELAAFVHELDTDSWKSTILPMLVEKELETPGPEAAQRAAELLRHLFEALPEDDSKVFNVIYRCAAEIQQRGVDTSDLSEYILKKHHRYDPSVMERVHWVFTIGSTELFQTVLSRNELIGMAIELLCQGIEDEQKRELIRPTVLRMQAQLMTQNELVPVLLVLLKLYGVDVSAHADSTAWEYRFGAIVAEAVVHRAPRETREYLSRMTREQDRDVRFALLLNYLLRSQSPGEAVMADFDQFYYPGYDYLPRLTRAIVTACGLERRFPTVALDSFLQDYRSREELQQHLGDHGDFFLVRLLSPDEKWRTSFFDNLLQGFPRDVNILLHALDAPDERIDAYLQELFLDCDSDEDACALLLVAEARGKPFISDVARIRASVLQSNPGEVQLEKDEFELLYPTLLDTSLEWTLLIPLIRSCGTLLQQHPERLMALIRAWRRDEEVLLELVKLVAPAKGDSLSVALSNARDGVYHKDLPVAVRFFRHLEEIYANVVQSEAPELRDSHLLLMLARDTDAHSLETVETLYRLLAEKMSLSEQAGYFAGGLCRMNETEQQATALHISRHPDPVFAPLLNHLRDSNSVEVRKTVRAAADRLVATTAARFPVASLVREPMEHAVLHARSRISDPELYRQHLERTCIVSLVDIESPIPRDTAVDALMTVSMINNLVLYLQVDYADEKQAAVVARVGAQETTETLSWLMEQRGVAHFVVQ